MTDSRKIFLAVATHGLEAVSSVWTMEDGNGFVELKEVATVGKLFFNPWPTLYTYLYMVYEVGHGSTIAMRFMSYNICLFNFVGATDVIFTKADGKLFLTLAQVSSNKY